MTAVEWLIEEIECRGIVTKELRLAFEQAKKMEKEQQSYSEEDMKSAFKAGFSIGYGSDVHAIYEKNRTCKDWFEQFKNK